MDILRTGLLFVLTGLAEIDGGWLVWQWLRNNWGWPWGSLGGAIAVSFLRIAGRCKQNRPLAASILLPRV